MWWVGRPRLNGEEVQCVALVLYFAVTVWCEVLSSPVLIPFSTVLCDVMLLS